MKTIESFFKPKSVAIIGATANERKVGYALLRNMLSCGYPGKLYPVNPKRNEIMGMKCYPSPQKLPETPELAVLVVPPEACVRTVEELGQMGTRAFLVISAGFKEAGDEGKALEKKLVDAANAHGALIVGPNCLGIIDTHTPLNATFATVMPPRGNVAVLSQSGAVLSAFFDWSIDEGVGFSKVVSLGNQAQLDESHFFNYLSQDPSTEAILAYIEGVEDGKRLIKALKNASLKKPVIVLKVGRSKKGARASSSHTGSIAGSDDAYSAAFRRAGALRVKLMQELFIGAKAFSLLPRRPVKSIAILTNAGGPGIIATDAIEEHGMELAELSEAAKSTLKKILPPMASVNNPVDVIGDANAERYARSLDVLLDAPEVDGVIVLLTPQLMTEITETARCIARRKGRKPVVCAFMGEHRVAGGVEVLKSHGIPNYQFPEEAVKAFELLNTYQKTKGGFPEPEMKRDLEGLKELLKKDRFQADTLDEFPSMEILKAAGIETPRMVLAKSPREAKEAAEHLGFPVVMKISSPDVLHKSDIGGVMTGVGPDQVEEAFLNIVERAKRAGAKNIRGVLVEESAPRGVDLIVGFKKDPTFGHLLMVGLGGIYVEILKDVSFGICPVSEKEALFMMRELKSYPILEGARGGVRVNLEALARTISLFSFIPVITGLSEGEINPLRATESRIMALDARFTKA